VKKTAALLLALIICVTTLTGCVIGNNQVPAPPAGTDTRPDRPSTPDTPGEPADPGVPDKPDTPDDPGVPADPGVPDDPPPPKDDLDNPADPNPPGNPPSQYIVTYGGRPITPLLGMSPEYVVSILGIPISENYDDRGEVINLYFDDILLWFDGGRFTFLENYDPGVLEIDGVTLNKTRNTLVGLLGEPDSENWGEGAYGGDNVFIMNYYIDNYRLYLEFEYGPDAPPYMALISLR